MASFEFDLGDFWIVFPVLLAFVVFLPFGSVIGAIAASKGRSFWGHTIVCTLLIAPITIACVAGGLWIIPLIIYAILIISFAVSDKTDKKRRQEIEEEERIRQQIRSRYERREPSYPAERPAPSKDDHERYMPNPKGKTINDLYRD